MRAQHPRSGPRTGGPSRPVTGEGRRCHGSGTVAAGAAPSPAPEHTAQSLLVTAPVRRDLSLSGSVVPPTPVRTGGGCSPAPQNFPEHLKSPLLGQGCWSSRAPPSRAFILPSVQPARLDRNRHHPPTLAAGSTPPLRSELSFPAASPGGTARPSTRPLRTAWHRRTPGCPCPTSRRPGPHPCVPALPARPVPYGPPSLSVPGHMPAPLDPKAQSTGQPPS